MPDTGNGKQYSMFWVILGIVLFLAGAGWFVKHWLDQASTASSDADAQAASIFVAPLDTPTAAPTATTVPTPAPVVVHISGAVVQPDVYEMPHDARVIDVVRAAGGLLDDAASDRINLAARIADGQHIHVPRVDEEALPESGDDTVPPPNELPNEPVNINTASVAQLAQLPGIGEVTAQSIVDYRTTNGLFATVDDLQNVSGIGPATMDNLRDRLRVE